MLLIPILGRQRESILVVHWLVSLDKLAKFRPMRSLNSKEVGSLSKVDSQACPLASLHMHTHVYPPQDKYAHMHTYKCIKI